MKLSSKLLFLLACGVVVAASGCHHLCRRQAAPACPPQPPGYAPANPAYPQPYPAPGPAPTYPAPTYPAPGGVPTYPAPAYPPQGYGAPPQGYVPPTSNSPLIPPPPTPISSQVRTYGPTASVQAEPAWQPSQRPSVRLSMPEIAQTEPPREAARPAVEPMPPAEPKPAVTEERKPSPALPVGIPQFAAAKDQVATGLKPFLDGLDWLHTNGYRTVMHLKAPGEDDSADRQLVERHGLKFISLDVSPQTLNRGVLDQFSKTVNDPAGYPLFVYDSDGTLGGGLWYLHFRMTESLADDVARAKAAQLGLRENASDAQRTMWLAVQKLVDAPR